MKKLNNRHAYFGSNFKTREADNGKKYIEGYFAVFNQETELWSDMFEKIGPHAFDETLANDDIRCLFNHDSGFVLGRNSAKTLQFKIDDYGLFGVVEINTSDTQAMNVYARVQRGDITGCSFGFETQDESYEVIDNAQHWTINKCKLFEVSVCTYPAYPQTEIQARKQDCEIAKKRKLEQEKEKLKNKLEALTC